MKNNKLNHQYKIKDLDELAHILAPVKARSEKIVHCHGVFDLLHIGHIRHFQQAKALGDLLVVTITADEYVNKGPGRPAFRETLRAEAIASLECVDYVAINRFPMAVEAILLFTPDFYVKGSDYRENDSDITGGIILEAQAISSVGGEIVYTDDITYSSSNLINKHMPVLSKPATDFLKDFSSKYSESEVFEFLNQMKSMKVLVVGEAIIDEYQYCQAIGKSSKEPMLAVKQLSTEQFGGGILAVANNISNFCDNVGLITVLGASNSHEEFIRNSLNAEIETSFVYRTGAPTIVKRRFVEEYHFTKLLEVYEIDDGAMDGPDNDNLCALLKTNIPNYDAVIVVDFGHGMLGPEAVEILSEDSRFLAMNSQSNAGNFGYHTVSRFPRADLVCIAETEARLETRNRYGDLRKVILEISKTLSCDQIIVTRGKGGCLCYSKEEGFFDLPALADNVLDRMGSGDAFLSLAGMCVAQNVPMEVVGFIGNVAGAEAVATVGHRTSLEPVRLTKHIKSLMK